MNLRPDLRPMAPITRESVEASLNAGPRLICFASTHANALKRSPDTIYCGAFDVPFWETIGPLLMEALNLRLFPVKQFEGYWRSVKTEPEYRQIEEWIRLQGDRIFIRDCLFCSIALDHNKPDPNSPNYTELGLLEHQAKEHQSEAAIDSITDLLSEAIRSLPFYGCAPFIVAVPPSPGKTFDLPSTLADRIARTVGKRDLTANFFVEGEKHAGKELPLGEKWRNWEAARPTFRFDLEGQDIILIDDLYQSGTTMQFIGMKLQEANAGRVLGLTVVKSLRNTANI